MEPFSVGLAGNRSQSDSPSRARGCRRAAGPCPDGRRRNHRPREGSGRRGRSRRDHHRHRNTDESAASGRVDRRRRLHRREPGARRVPPRRRARRLQAGAPRGHPSVDRRKGAHRFRPQRRRRSRTGDGRRRRADRASGDREPRHGRRERAGRAAAAERPPVHHARRHRPGRRAAAELRPAAHQRRAAAHERVSLRRHLRAAARAGAGGVLPGHRRDPGVQDREQQPAGRVRPVQRRRGQPDDEVGRQRLSRQRVRVLPQRGAERPELLPVEQSGEAGLPPQSVRRHVRRPARRRTGRSSSSTIRVSDRPSAAR